MPPGDEHVHVFVAESERERALALHPAFVEKLLWGGKVRGLRVQLAGAVPLVVKQLVRDAWACKAPKILVASVATPSKDQDP